MVDPEVVDPVVVDPGVVDRGDYRVAQPYGEEAAPCEEEEEVVVSESVLVPSWHIVLEVALDFSDRKEACGLGSSSADPCALACVPLEAYPFPSWA